MSKKPDGAWIDATREQPENPRMVLIHSGKPLRGTWIGKYASGIWLDEKGGKYPVAWWMELPDPASVTSYWNGIRSGTKETP